MASSWAEYDASHRRGSGSDAHNGTSLHSSTSGTKKRRSGSTGAASSSGGAASSSGGAKRKSAKRAPTGIDALYVDAPPGIDTRLQFQWMRPHPSSAILAAAATAGPKSGGGGANISPHIVEAARLVEHYRQAKADSCPNGDSKNEPNESQKRRLPLPKVDMGCINAEVELTSLFDPPLLSEWGIPGASMNITYDDKNDDQGTFSDSDSDDESYARHAGGNRMGNSDGDGKSKQSNAAEIESALGKLVQCAAATKGTTRLDDPTKQIFCDISANTTGGHLLELLPSRMLLQKVRDVAPNARGGVSYLIGVKSLTTLADITQTESMGKHILSALAPVLLCSSSDMTMEMEGGIITSLELLAKALVQRCGLGKLSKGNLLQLAEGGEVGTGDTAEPSEWMDQFLIAIGRAYHE